MAGNGNHKKISVTTGIGTISFPHLFESTKSKNDKGEDSYDVQIIIPKSDRESLKAIMSAIKEVAQDRWGDNWRKVRNPLRDGDREADEMTDDGQTKGAKYPERLGCYFLNARSSKPVGVVDRARVPITNPNDIYGGCKGKLAVTFYSYATNGNSGVAAGLDGVQKVADGEPFGGGRPTLESMFDVLDDDDFEGEDGFTDLDEKPSKKSGKKSAKGEKSGKKSAKKPKPEEGEDDLYDDLDD